MLSVRRSILNSQCASFIHSSLLYHFPIIPVFIPPFIPSIHPFILSTIHACNYAYKDDIPGMLMLWVRCSVSSMLYCSLLLCFCACGIIISRGDLMVNVWCLVMPGAGRLVGVWRSCTLDTYKWGRQRTTILRLEELEALKCVA